MYVRLARVGESLFEGEAHAVQLPGIEGDMTILPHHAPLITPLRRGVVRITDTMEKQHQFEIHSGVAEVSNNEITVLV